MIRIFLGFICVLREISLRDFFQELRGFVISALGTDRGQPREPPAPSTAPSWHEALLATPPRSISAPAALGQAQRAQVPSCGDRGDRGDRDCYMTKRYQEIPRDTNNKYIEKRYLF